MVLLFVGMLLFYRVVVSLFNSLGGCGQLFRCFVGLMCRCCVAVLICCFCVCCCAVVVFCCVDVMPFRCDVVLLF